MTRQELFSAAEAAVYLGMSRTTVWRARKLGLLQPVGGSGRALRFARVELDALPARLPRSLRETVGNSGKR